MKKEHLTEALNKVTSKHLKYRIPRFLKNYPRRKKVANLKQQNNNSKEVMGKAFWGEDFNLYLPETVSSAIYTCAYFEENLTRSFIELLKPGNIFIDIGAHIGYFSKLASHIVGEQGKVFSFEPTQSTFSILSTNIKHNKNITAINKAVFSSNQQLKFNDYGPRFSAMNSFTKGRFENEEGIEYKSIKVEAIKLDDFVTQQNITPNFIKIDAESAEYDILLGMKKIMTDARPIITIEVGDFAIDNIKTSKEIIAFVLDHGYEAFQFDEQLRPHELKDHYDYQNIILIPKKR